MARRRNAGARWSCTIEGRPAADDPTGAARPDLETGMTIASQSESGFVDVEGARLWHEVVGDGPPLVLIHAGIADSRMWDDQIAPFATRHRVVRYDLRGYGRSPAVAGSFAHWRDLRGLLAELDLERVALVCCSMGGSVALDLALQHPKLVAALVLVGTPPGGFEIFDEETPQLLELDEAFEAGDVARAAELDMQIWVDGPQRAPNEVDPAVRERALAMDTIALASEMAGLGEAEPLDPPAVERLGEIHAPTLVVVGDLDQPGILRAAALMAERIPGARTATIAGTAHLPNMEQPKAFSRVVLDFLSDVW
jgi:pimeloyl-ACP methyl ester carboxylesterase